MLAWPVRGHSPGLFAGAFVLGATSLFLGPALQSRLIAVAPGAQLIDAAVNQSAMNVANSLGAASASWPAPGYHAPAWTGVALADGGRNRLAVGRAGGDRALAFVG